MVDADVRRCQLALERPARPAGRSTQPGVPVLDPVESLREYGIPKVKKISGQMSPSRLGICSPTTCRGHGLRPNGHQPLGGFVMKRLVIGYVKNESGATAIEYGLIAALISVVIIGVLSTIGTNLSAKFNDIADQLD